MEIKNKWIEKWEKEYIDNIDLSNIEWINLDNAQLINFYKENYLDERLWQYASDGLISTEVQCPLGMKYLSYDNYNEYNFLLGVAKNNCYKKTILCAMIYLENYYAYKAQIIPVTYIISVETNKYFRNKGLYKKLCEESINYLNPEQHIITSKESEIGKECGAFKILKDILISNGFDKTIWIDDSSNYIKPEFQETVCGKQKTLK